MIVKASDFATRKELEEHIQVLPNKKATIQGTKEELKRLFLSPYVTVYGVSVVEVDEKGAEKERKPKEPKEKPNRGEIHPSGLNGVLKDNK